MSYLDVWIYNSKPRMRVFLCYLLIFVAFFIFSDIMIYLYTKSLYQPIENYEIQVNDAEVTVIETGVSNVNGNIRGTIKNTTDETFASKYLKFDFYTQRDVHAGVKYLKIGYLNPEEQKNYKLEFRYDNVNSVEISMVDEQEVKDSTPEQMQPTLMIGPAGMLSGILFLSSLL